MSNHWQDEWTSPCGTVRLLLGDCRGILPTLEADAVLFDPPYGIAYKTNRGDSQVKDWASWAGQEISGDDDTSTRDAILAWCELKPWACFGSWKVATPSRARGVLIWDKGTAFGMGDLSFPWKPSWEEIAVGGPGWIGVRDEGVLRGHMVVTWESHGRVHPNEKPVSLIEHMLEKLPHARTVCDPTMGSGTTGVACVRTGRRFIGIEIEPKYFEIAKRRIQAEINRFPLFEPKPVETQAELFRRGVEGMG